MNIILVFSVALALAMDAFAVSVGLSISLHGMNRGQAFRLAFHFGFFQFLMPILGWLTGKNLLKYVQAYDHWLAFGLLAFIGFKMILESFKSEKERKRENADPTKGLSLIVLAVATSLDAFAVGLGFALLPVNILCFAAVIGIVAFLLTIFGSKSGHFLGNLVGKRAELLGGLILIFIGLKILFDHIL
ncbi:manganese efflux pump MntP family protein [Acidobacteriota bacterium]